MEKPLLPPKSDSDVRARLSTWKSVEKPLLPPKSDSDVRAKLSTWKSAGETQTGKSEIKRIRVIIYKLMSKLQERIGVVLKRTVY